MSTNASVHVKGTDGKVRSIYVHWDGYVERPGVGNKLSRCYTTQESVDKLIMMGDCSSLADSLEDSEFYHRDRNEDWEDVQPNVNNDLESSLSVNSQEFDYYFDGNTWYLVSSDCELSVI